MNELKTFEKDPKVIEELNAIPTVLGHVDNLTINSPETEIRGAELRKTIKGMLKAIEGRRKFFTIPLEELKKNIIATCNKISAPILEMEKTVKKKQLDYHDYLKAEQRKAEEKRRIEQEEKDKQKAAAEKEAEGAETFDDMVKAEEKIQESEAAPLTPDIEVKNNVKGVGTSTSFRQVWKHEVQDTAKIPRGFLIVDNAAIRDAIRNGVRDIPGVRIYQETITSVR